MFVLVQDEEAAESRPAKLFISTHNRQSEECSQLIKSILAGVCTFHFSSSSLRDTSFNIHELNKSPCCVVFLYFIVCSGKISDGRDNLEDNIIEVKAIVKSIKSLVQW